MFAIEPQQSLFKRSTSLLRRFSKREQRPNPNPHPSDNPRVAHKLQKRAANPVHLSTNKNIITHLQRVHEPPKGHEDDIEPTSHAATRVVATNMQLSRFPTSSHIHTVSWNVFLTPEQAYSLVMGFAPQQMEDKWFIYSEGPDMSGKLKVHFHRSWTGMKMAELFVLIDLKGEGAGKIVGIKWNGSEQTNGMNEEEAKYMISTTCAWVLGVDMEQGVS